MEIVVGDHESARIDSTEIFEGDGDDDKKASTGEGEAERSALGLDKDKVGNERDKGD